MAAQFVSFLLNRTKNGVNGPSSLCSFWLKAYYYSWNYLRIVAVATGVPVHGYVVQDTYIFSEVPRVVIEKSFRQ